jgi:endonuclease/exonuclease/phosphatase family metal-dependent hydrolase
MKRILLVSLLLSCFVFYPQTKLISWNIANFGQSKSDKTIHYIANYLKGYDIIAVQVVAGYGGVQAVARLSDELNRTGSKWDYIISDPTSSSPYKTERYAFIWKTNKLKQIGKAWLEKKYHSEIEREPYLGTFQYQDKQFTVVNFHAITKQTKPETEIKYFKFFPGEYPTLNLIFAGDFNCPQSHTVFIPLRKMGYQSILVGQKTSLKQKYKNNNYLASEYDNMYYKTSKIKSINKGVLSFYKDFNTLKEARKVSDHIPIWFEFSLN